MVGMALILAAGVARIDLLRPIECHFKRCRRATRGAGQTGAIGVKSDRRGCDPSYQNGTRVRHLVSLL